LWAKTYPDLPCPALGIEIFEVNHNFWKMAKSQFIEQLEILLVGTDKVVSERIDWFEETCIEKFNAGKMKELSGTFERIVADARTQDSHEDYLVTSIEEKTRELETLGELVCQKKMFVAGEKARMTTQYPKLESLVDNLGQMSLTHIQEGKKQSDLQGRQRARDLDALKTQISGLEKKVAVYQETFKLELDKTQKNTLRVKFLELDSQEKPKNNPKQCYLDLVTSDTQILIHSSHPPLKDRLSFQDSLNFHKRLDIFLSDIRYQFSNPQN
jgi:hypothetical protein